MFKSLGILFVLLAAHFVAGEAAAQTTEFTYQGILKDGAVAANGNYDFEFRLFNQPTGGVQIGITLQRLNVPVTQGIFTVSLDFGAAAFNGPDRLIGIDIRPSGGGTFTTLGPRQKVNSTPYSVRSLNSASADQATNASQLGGVAAGQYVITTDPRMSDARNPLANSPNYIQNTTVQQAASNFSIAGNGTAGGTLSGNAVNAVTQYNIDGSRVLGGTSLALGNLFVGLNAGQANGGSSNSFFGLNAGQLTTGLSNSFFGRGSGQDNTTGGGNSFFGTLSGENHTTGSSNSFFGESAGAGTLTGSDNAFFGKLAGRNTNGNNNSFFGRSAGVFVTTGSDNSFFGRGAGASTLNGNGISNTLIGSLAEVTGSSLSFATAIGAQATVGSSNTIVLGRSGGQDQVNIPGNLNVTGTLTGALPAGSSNYIQNTVSQQAASNFNIAGNGTALGTLSGGTVNATTQYNLGGSRLLFAGVTSTVVGINAGGAGSFGAFLGHEAGIINVGGANTFLGYRSGNDNTNGGNNTFVGFVAGQNNITGGSNSFVGANAGEFNTGSDNVAIGANAGGPVNAGDGNTFLGARTGADNGLSNATAVGYRAKVTQSNSLVLGSIAGSFSEDTNVGIGTTAPARRLHVSSGSSGAVPIGSGDLVVEDNAAAFQHFLTPDDSESGILFGDPTDSIAGGIVFNNAVTNNGMMFRSGGNTTRMVLDGSGNLGLGILVPNDKLDVIGSIRVSVLGVGGAAQLCRNASQQISTCSSSLRYKSNIGRFTDGLAFVNRLQPITFDWKAGGMKDVGFGAEDIAAIDPRFVTYSSNGEVEGVKYDRLSVVFVNAMKEQQAEIDLLKQQVRTQQAENQALRNFICSKSPEAEFCRLKP